MDAKKESETELPHSSMDTFEYTGDWKPVMENVAKALKEMAINHEHW